MKSTGVVRRVDGLGRVVIPKELRTTMRIDFKDPLEIFTQGDMIILREYTPGCIICGSMDDTKTFKGKLICGSCIDACK